MNIKNYQQLEPFSYDKEKKRSDYIYSITSFGNNKLWLGKSNGIASYNYKDEKFKYYGKDMA